MSGLPTISTPAVFGITSTSAIVESDVTSEGGSAVTDRGICFSTRTGPTIWDSKVSYGSSYGFFELSLYGLMANAKYFLRPYGVNSAGVGYGEEVQFTTTGDFETVTIGTQVWMKYNLDVLFYRNGDPIPQVSDATAWPVQTSGAWCYYNNDVSNEFDCGKLYNWYAVHDSRNIAPLGWHVPTDAEWSTLVSLTGGNTTAGDVLKEAGTRNWTSPNTGATNGSGFTGLPGGGRGIDGAFIGIGNLGSCWTVSEVTPGSFLVFCYQMNYDQSAVSRVQSSKVTGFSVRCIKD